MFPTALLTLATLSSRDGEPVVDLRSTRPSACVQTMSYVPEDDYRTAAGWHDGGGYCMHRRQRRIGNKLGGLYWQTSRIFNRLVM